MVEHGQDRLRDGSVRTPTDRTVLEQLAKLEAAFPSAVRHRLALRNLGSEFVYARALDSTLDLPDLRGAWIALLRFGLVLETTFGFTREVLIVYSPHRDLQIRTVQAVPQILGSLPRSVTDGTVLIYAPDPRLAEKLDDWSTSRLLGVPMPDVDPSEGEASAQVLHVLQRRIFRRDMYAETTPVHGRNFFGRHLMLQSLVDDVRARRVAGIFGLRKAGKTSLLHMIRGVLEDDKASRHIFLLRDLESLPSLPQDVISPLIADLREDLTQQLRLRKLRVKELVDLSPEPDIPQFRRALHSILGSIASAGVRVIVALDEIEYLCPPDRYSTVSSETQAIPQFFGALRSLVQETDNFTFIIAGLTSAAVEAGQMFGRHNPLFSWAKEYYVSPFTLEESAEILQVLGGQMGLRWDDDAVRVAHQLSGGHVYLLRSLASDTVKRMPLEARERVVARGMVTRVAGSWKRAVSVNMRETLDHLTRYYPDERVLLDLLLDDRSSFETLADSVPEAVLH